MQVFTDMHEFVLYASWRGIMQARMKLCQFACNYRVCVELCKSAWCTSLCGVCKAPWDYASLREIMPVCRELCKFALNYASLRGIVQVCVELCKFA